MEHDKAQELRDADGKLVGYFLPPQAYAELRGGYEELRQQVRESVPIATEEQEEEFRQQLANETWLDGDRVLTDFIRELRGGNGPT
jgi:hypothetical protein